MSESKSIWEFIVCIYFHFIFPRLTERWAVVGIFTLFIVIHLSHVIQPSHYSLCDTSLLQLVTCFYLNYFLGAVQISHNSTLHVWKLAYTHSISSSIATSAGLAYHGSNHSNQTWYDATTSTSFFMIAYLYLMKDIGCLPAYLASYRDKSWTALFWLLC